MALPIDYPKDRQWYCLVCGHEWCESVWSTQKGCPKCAENDKRQLEQITRNFKGMGNN